jgi:hypothetical protein
MSNDTKSKAQTLAGQPEKALFCIWGLLAFGLLQRIAMPAIAGNGGIIIVSAPLVLCVMVAPAYLAAVVFRYNKGLTASGKAMLGISAVATTVFGAYLFAWAVSS